jgi:hypothetical protein
MKPHLARWRVRAGYPAAAAYFLLAHPRPRLLVAGAALGAVGLLWRAWAAGYLQKNRQLSTSGPYGHTRNPLYFGSLWLAAGMAVAAGSIAAAAIVVAYWLAFYPATMRAEERELAARYGDAYADYAARVPAFWPRWRVRQSGPRQKFRFQLYWQNREYRAALGYLLALALLALKMLAR